MRKVTIGLSKSLVNNFSACSLRAGPSALVRFNSTQILPPNQLSRVEIIEEMDTTLTPEQQEYVNTLKKKIKGGHLSKKCERCAFNKKHN